MAKKLEIQRCYFREERRNNGLEIEVRTKKSTHPTFLVCLMQECGKEQSHLLTYLQRNHYFQESWSFQAELSSTCSIVFLKLNWRLIIN